MLALSLYAPAGYALQAPHQPLATRTALPLVARAVHMKEAETADPALASEIEECLLDATSEAEVAACMEKAPSGTMFTMDERDDGWNDVRAALQAAKKDRAKGVDDLKTWVDKNSGGVKSATRWAKVLGEEFLETAGVLPEAPKAAPPSPRKAPPPSPPPSPRKAPPPSPPPLRAPEETYYEDAAPAQSAYKAK